MRYHRLHINHFGRLQNVTMTFSDRINVIRTADPSEEETLRAFLETMQLGMDCGEWVPPANDTYHRYFPDSGSSTYSGVLEFETADTTYSIYRNFFRDPRSYTLMDETHNKSLSLNAEEYRHLMQGMTLPLYRGTIDRPSREAGPGDDAPLTVTEYRDNLCRSGSASLDLDRACRDLQQERRRLEASLSPETEEKALELARSIDRLSAERDKMLDASELSVWEKQLDAAAREIEAMQAERRALEEEIRKEEDFLAAYASTSGAALQDAENRCMRLLDRRSRLLKQYPDPASNPLRQAYPALTFASAAAVVIGLLLAVIFFVRGNTPLGILGLAVGAAGGLLCRRFLKQIQALNAFRYVDRSLRRLYTEILPEIPDQIDQQSLDDFLALMQDLKQRRTKLQRDHRKAESAAGRIHTLRENRERIQSRAESRKKEFREKIQLDEKILRLMDEKEALAPVLERNRSLQADIEAIDLALDTIEQLSATAFREHSAFIRSAASQILLEMTQGRCDDLTACREHQALLALRLAAIKAMNAEEPVPVLLDGTFLPAEDEALCETMAWMSRSYAGQILLFTHTDREAALLEQAQIERETISL